LALSIEKTGANEGRHSSIEIAGPGRCAACPLATVRTHVKWVQRWVPNALVSSCRLFLLVFRVLSSSYNDYTRVTISACRQASCLNRIEEIWKLWRLFAHIIGCLDVGSAPDYCIGRPRRRAGMLNGIEVSKALLEQARKAGLGRILRTTLWKHIPPRTIWDVVLAVKFSEHLPRSAPNLVREISKYSDPADCFGRRTPHCEGLSYRLTGFEPGALCTPGTFPAFSRRDGMFS